MQGFWIPTEVSAGKSMVIKAHVGYFMDYI